MKETLVFLVSWWLTSACGGSMPETRYYDLAAPAARPATAGDVTLAIEPLEVDDAYDDERIAYRQSRVRLDYYHYHRWSAPPGVLVANALERSLERSGRFRAVVRDQAGVRLVLGGRVVAIEEVDVSKKRWVGRIALELHLRDADTGEIIWSADLEEREPLRDQSPEGLARALSAATTRLAGRIAPQLAATAQR
ncbi:MAG TPA: ABC-type transport auxiliary lipoprotein family protein [Kofleriaceae bacterium]|nr:ABC-type transport auxiliary lipoprotein family protein [Kofleriaceae bacterium]